MTQSPVQQQSTVPIEFSAQEALELALEKSLRMAMNFHSCGKIENAETLYRGILDIQPNHPEANYRLGILALQLSQARSALPHLAIALGAQQEDRYWLGYVDAMMQANELESAQELLALGQLHGLTGDGFEALTKQLDRRVAQFVSDAKSVVAVEQEVTPGPSNKKKDQSRFITPGKRAKKALLVSKESQKLAGLFKRGKLSESEALAHTLTLRFPSHGFYWKVLGTAIQLQGRFDAALLPLQTAARLWPEDAETLGNLGLVLKCLERWEDAEESYRRALRLAPEDTNINNNLGTLRRSQGRFVEAEIHYRRALATNPKFAIAHGNLGNALNELGRLEEAEVCYKKALEIDPAFAEAHHNLGFILYKQGRLKEAEATFRLVLDANPESSDFHTSLGTTLQRQGKLAEAEARYRLALQLRPNCVVTNSSLLFCLSHSQAIGAAPLFAEHRHFGERFEAPLRPLWRAHSNSHDPNRCLQIGFVSGDLCSHAVASFIEPIFKQLTSYAGTLSLHVYFSQAVEDAVTQRLRGYVKHWHTIASLSDDGLAEKVRADEIDILIDLSGHTGFHRLLAFARRPAPVQISWIGYPGTTGLSSMDYFLSDRFFLPSGLFDNQFTEKLVYLPACAPFLPEADAPPVNDLPALRNGHITFGSFNRLNKISPAVIALWSQLLRTLPTSRMVLGAMPQDGQYDTLIGWFADEGIARQRLSFHPRADMRNYLAQHHQVDICLDAFPYNGSTTSLHAVCMGVPTLTMAGSTPAGRAGAWILGHLGLDEFVATDAAEFVRNGVLWADRLPEMARLRVELRERFAQSALGQPALIAAGLERALRIMWQRWCAGLPAVSFEVSQADIDQATQEADA